MLPEISTEISDQNFGNNFKIQICFSENRQNWHFRDVDFGRKEVRSVKNFFLIEFGLICRKKFFTSPNLWGASPALWESVFTHQHQFWKKNYDIDIVKSHFYSVLKSCIFANNLQNFTKLRVRTFGAQWVPMMLPEFSIEISD